MNKAQMAGEEPADNDDESTEMPMPTGEIQGDDRELRDRGTSIGMSGKDPHLDGADTGPEAINRIGGFRADSDDPDQSMPCRAMKGRC